MTATAAAKLDRARAALKAADDQRRSAVLRRQECAVDLALDPGKRADYDSAVSACSALVSLVDDLRTALPGLVTAAAAEAKAAVEAPIRAQKAVSAAEHEARRAKIKAHPANAREIARRVAFAEFFDEIEAGRGAQIPANLNMDLMPTKAVEAGVFAGTIRPGDGIDEPQWLVIDTAEFKRRAGLCGFVASKWHPSEYPDRLVLEFGAWNERQRRKAGAAAPQFSAGGGLYHR